MLLRGIIFSTNDLVAESHSVKYYFTLFSGILNTVQLATLVWTMVFQSEKILDLFNITYQTFKRGRAKLVKYEQNIRIRKIFTYSSLYFKCIASVLITVFVVQLLLSNALQVGDPIAVFYSSLLEVRKLLWLPNVERNQLPSPENILLVICFVWFKNAYYRMQATGEILYATVYPLNLLLATIQFEKVVENSKPGCSIEEIANDYENLKSISDRLSKLWGKSTLMFIINSFLRGLFVWNIKSQAQSYLVKGFLMFVWVVTIVGLVFAAETFSKVIYILQIRISIKLF